MLNRISVILAARFASVKALADREDPAPIHTATMDGDNYLDEGD